MKLTTRSRLLMALTVFSLFFGAGNLIFPPFLAAQAGTQTWPAMLGFCLTAIGCPVLGVVAVARFGSLERLAGQVHPVFAGVFILLIYLAIGPGLAIPRTASTSFEMLALAFAGPDAPLGLLQAGYSLLFFALATLIALKPAALTQRLGKVLCPTLLCLIAVLFAASLAAPHGYGPVNAEAYAAAAPLQGFLDGYQTMDAIAALVFGGVIALNLQGLGVKDEKAMVAETTRAGLGAGVLLLVVYCALAHVGGVSGGAWPGAANGAQVLTNMADGIFGHVGMVLLAAIFVVACLNTCIGLLSSVGGCFHRLMPRLSYPVWVGLFALLSAVISNAGLNQILSLSVPVLNLLYPPAIVLILLAFVPDSRHRPLLWPLAGWTTAAVSALTCAGRAGLLPAALTGLLEHLPLYFMDLAWLLPAAIAAAIGWAARRSPE